MKFLPLLCSLSIVIACTSPPVASQEKNKTKQTAIHVTNHGWHTGIVIPSRIIQTHLPQLQQRFVDIHFIEIGWGDRGFYQAKEITVDLSIKAILWPTESIVHAVGFNRHPKKYFSKSQVKTICLDESNYTTLINFLINSFAKNSLGQLIEMSPGIYGDSQFYQGKGSYSLAQTCNKWTAQALQSAAIDISPTFILTADSVMDTISESTHCQN